MIKRNWFPNSKKDPRFEGGFWWTKGDLAGIPKGLWPTKAGVLQGIDRLVVRLGERQHSRDSTLLLTSAIDRGRANLSYTE